MIIPVYIAGVDPGKKGSACIVEVTDWIRLIKVFPFGNDWQTDLYSLLINHRPAVVGLENVHSKTGQGVKSVFTFGSGKGGCEAAIKIAGHKIHYVEQTVWPRTVGLKGSDDKKKRKAEQDARAIELFAELADKRYEKYDIFASTLIATAVALELCLDFRSAYMAKYAPQRRAMTPEELAYQVRLHNMLRPMTAEQERNYRGITWEDLL